MSAVENNGAKILIFLSIFSAGLPERANQDESRYFKLLFL